MKKYFTLIAVAMLSTASVFTSCNKDDDASGSFGSSVSTEQSTNKTTKVTVSTTNSIYGDTDSKNSEETAAQSMKSLMGQKLASLATVSLETTDIYSHTYYNIKVTPNEGVTADQLKDAVKDMTKATFDDVLSKVDGLNTYTFQYSVNGEDVINYTYANPAKYLTSMPEGSWTSKDEKVNCTVNLSNKETTGDATHKCYEATVVYNGESFHGYAYVPGNVVTATKFGHVTVFTSESNASRRVLFFSDAASTQNKELAHVMLSMTFDGGSNDTSVASCDMSMDTYSNYVFDEVEFGK